MNIALIGFRGTGKTSVSCLLADRLERRLLSTDNLIVLKTGKTISGFVQKEGWGKFRELETEALKEALRGDNLILDCGGGVIVRKENITYLKEKAKVILLTADEKIILTRIKDDPSRPALKKGLSLEREIILLLEERKEKYLLAADFIIDTSRRSITEVVNQIIDFLAVTTQHNSF